jgi:iron complex transport system permease protein
MSTVTPTLDPPIVAVRSARRRVARRTAYAITGLTVVWIAVFLVRITQGDYLISLPDAVRIIRGAEIPGASYILMESKLPRAVLGTGVGVALGLAGAIFQTTLRNELASPDIVGVTLGASSAAVFGIVVLGQSGSVISALAVAGALGVALTVRALADGHNGYRLVLLGIGISAVMSAVIQYLFTRVDEFNATKVLQWLGGSLSNVEWRAIGSLLRARRAGPGRHRLAVEGPAGGRTRRRPACRSRRGAGVCRCPDGPRGHPRRDSPPPSPGRSPSSPSSPAPSPGR